jgi:hypothetical protein
MDNKNLIIEGRLEMKPQSSSIVHLIQFINVDESIFVGGGMVPLSTDIGLWVIDNGVADLHGSPKVGWNRTGNDSTWLTTDEMLRTPWDAGDYYTFASHTKGTTPNSVVAPNGHVVTQEVFNLTRNVRIEGTPGHKTHFFVRTDVPQTIEYVAFRYMGPLTDQNLSTTYVLGRWPTHFHHLGEAGRTTTMTGCVVRDSGTFSFVAHASHGVIYTDCISYKTNNAGFWWDYFSLDDQSFDVEWNHCMTAGVQPLPSFRGFNSPAFVASPGTGTMNDCVAVGSHGAQNASGYQWPENPGLGANGLWEFVDCVSHNNNRQGIYAWQNTGTPHHIHDYTGYRNGDHAIRHGAYANRYTYDHLTLFENGGGAGSLGGGFNMLANSSTPGPAPLTVSDMETDGILFGEHVLTSSFPAVIRDSTCHWAKVSEGQEPQNHQGRYDLVSTDLEPVNWTVSYMHPLSVYRVQRSNGTAYQVMPNGTTPSISAFYLYISTVALTSGVLGTAYSQQMVSLLGTGAVTWRLRPGSAALPPGLSISSSGLISGTPSVVGTYPVTIEATDAITAVAQRSFSLVVTGVAALQITTSSLPGGFIGTSYSQTLVATGGTGTGKVWTLVSGTLPTGIGLSSGGVISGTPTTAATYNFTVRVTDSGSNTTTRAFSIVVTNLNPTITTASPLPGGGVGVAYSTTLAATGGTSPYTWSVVSGALPAGLSLAASTGIISGTPTTVQAPSVVIRCTDAAARTNDKTFSLTIVVGLSFLASTPTPGRVGIPYSFTFTAQNGATPYSFVVGQSTDLPDGLTLSTTGVLSGTPTLSGIFVFGVIVTDATSVTATTTPTVVITDRVARSTRSMTTRGHNRYISVS